VKAHRVVRHFLGNRLTDNGEVVSLTRRQLFTLRKIDSWYSFPLEAESTLRAIVRLEELDNLIYLMTSLGIEPANIRLVA
jgi:hypothetical protein